MGVPTGNQGTVPAPAIAAERIKFFSLRSLTWMLWLGIICMVGTAWLLGASAKAGGDNGFDTYTPAPELVFSTLQLAQLFFATAAALCLTTEYSSGTITSSLQAVPRRAVLYAAKAVFLFVTGTVMEIVGVGLGTVPTALSAGEYGVFDTVDLIRALVGAGVYLGLMMLMVLGSCGAVPQLGGHHCGCPGPADRHAPAAGPGECAVDFHGRGLSAHCGGHGAGNRSH